MKVKFTLYIGDITDPWCEETLDTDYDLGIGPNPGHEMLEDALYTWQKQKLTVVGYYQKVDSPDDE